MTIHINIGSNRGDSLGNIHRAIAAIAMLFPPGTPKRVSRPFHSAPWGYESENEFVNVGVSFDLPYLLSESDAEALMLRLLEIQASIDPAPHRTPDGAYADRAIDIDFICADGLRVSTPVLTLPHPLMHLREFVLVPLAECEKKP